jgi:tetratricopeptide (TPR) repeat protein
LEHLHQSSVGEKVKMKIIATALLLIIFVPPGLTQVTIDFQSQPTSEQLLQVIENATEDKNYPTALRVANNAIKQFPNLAEAYYYRAIALSSMGNRKDARLDFEQAKKIYLGQLKSAKISTQEKSEARTKLETVEQNLLLLKS